ncbi:MAG: PD-(D/E)XK nuclease family protein, partial [Lachnospiraceae bacterium]|nr:PD-(D/E)XK nuclease family protein [Candidatus Minthocola equi]
MAFRLITGAQGSGKTNKIFTELIKSSIDNPDRKHIVITPDQNTLLTERRLLALSPNGVLFNIEVESFDRLAYKIFDELGLPMPTLMDEVGKSMLLRKIVREHQSDLSYYDSSIDKEGFITKLKAIISEFLSYGISPEDLISASDNTSSDLLKYKLKDLAVILKAFNEGHTEKNSPREELMSRLLSVVNKSAYFDDAFVVIDAFTGFSPLHYQLIEHIMSRAILVAATLTISPDINVFGTYNSHDLFAITLETAKELQTCAEHCGLKTEHEVIDDYADIERPEELTYLERHFLRPHSSEKLTIKNNNAIDVVHANYPSNEASFAAETISYLVSEKGYKYRDFAIVSNDLDKSAHDISRAMEEYGIPYFLDCHDDLHNHPLVRFILGALEVIECGFSISSVFAFLRTGLSSVPFDDIDILENYFLGTGIRGYKKCGEQFTREFFDYDLAKVNEIRVAALNPLIDFREAYQTSASNTEFIDSILKLLADYNVKNNLQQIFDNSNNNFNNSERIYDSVINVLAEASSMLPGKRLSAHQLKLTLTSGFQELSIGLLPPKLDQVQIGDIRRSRRGYVKVLIFMNMNDDLLPGGVAAGGILTDNDREELKNNNLILANSCIDNMFREQYYIYELLATPTDRLYLTYSDHFVTGAGRKPSSYVLRVLELFEGKLEHIYNPGLTSRNKICSEIGKCLEHDDIESASKLTKLLGDDVALIEQIHAVSSYTDSALLSPELTASVMKPEHLSVSALTTYADCPYKYFFERTLKLSDRKIYKVESTDRGSYVHSVLE